MSKVKSGFSFGIYTNARAALSARKIPSNLNYYRFDGEAFNNDFSVTPFKVAAMSWSELGFNLSRQVQTTTGTLAIGLNLKMLNGYEAFYFNNKSAFDMSKLRADTLTFQSLDVEYAFTNSNVDNDRFDLNHNGGGIGLDLGFSYVKGDVNNYWWKTGVAIVDLGRLKFINHAEKHQINTSTATSIDIDDYESLSTFEEQVNLLSFQTLNDSLASQVANDFNMWLPAAMTGYVDYRVADKVYVNALVVQSIPVGENAIVRDNLVAITPRYERRWFGAMLPVSLLNYRKLRVGASARFAFLTIGSENLASLFKQDEFTGTDFYVGIKINPFNMNWPGGKGSGGKNIKCYDF